MIQKMKSLLGLFIIMLIAFPRGSGFAQEEPTLIQDAQIVDGTGRDAFTGSVRIRNAEHERRSRVVLTWE